MASGNEVKKGGLSAFWLCSGFLLLDGCRGGQWRGKGTGQEEGEGKEEKFNTFRLANLI